MTGWTRGWWFVGAVLLVASFAVDVSAKEDPTSEMAYAGTWVTDMDAMRPLLFEQTRKAAYQQIEHLEGEARERILEQMKPSLTDEALERQMGPTLEKIGSVRLHLGLDGSYKTEGGNKPHRGTWSVQTAGIGFVHEGEDNDGPARGELRDGRLHLTGGSFPMAFIMKRDGRSQLRPVAVAQDLAVGVWVIDAERLEKSMRKYLAKMLVGLLDVLPEAERAARLASLEDLVADTVAQLRKDLAATRMELRADGTYLARGAGTSGAGATGTWSRKGDRITLKGGAGSVLPTSLRLGKRVLHLETEGMPFGIVLLPSEGEAQGSSAATSADFVGVWMIDIEPMKKSMLAAAKAEARKNLASLPPEQRELAEAMLTDEMMEAAMASALVALEQMRVEFKEDGTYLARTPDGQDDTGTWRWDGDNLEILPSTGGSGPQAGTLRDGKLVLSGPDIPFEIVMRRTTKDDE